MAGKIWQNKPRIAGAIFAIAMLGCVDVIAYQAFMTRINMQSWAIIIALALQLVLLLVFLTGSRERAEVIFLLLFMAFLAVIADRFILQEYMKTPKAIILVIGSEAILIGVITIGILISEQRVVDCQKRVGFVGSVRAHSSQA